MKVLVVGGSGFLGTNLCNDFARDFTLTVVARGSHRFQPSIPGVIYRYGDWSDEGFVRELFSDGTYDSVVILASGSHPRSAMAVEDDFLGNVVPCIRMISMAFRHGTHSLVFASSGGALYPSGIDGAKESDPLYPTSAYAQGKITIEGYLRRMVPEGHAAFALRIANPFGPHQDPSGQNGVIPIFLHKAISGDELTVYGDGSDSKDFIFVDDVVRAFRSCCEYRGSGHHVLNIGSGRLLTINDVVTSVVQLAGPVRVRSVARHGGGSTGTSLDISQAQRVLGWTPAETFAAGIEKTLDWLRRRVPSP